MPNIKKWKYYTSVAYSSKCMFCFCIKLEDVKIILILDILEIPFLGNED